MGDFSGDILKILKEYGINNVEELNKIHKKIKLDIGIFTTDLEKLKNK